MTAARFITVMVVCLILGFAGLNLLARTTLDGARIDLTERGLYQLSEGSVEVINRIDEPITLTFYYSRTEATQYPAIRAYGARVREMLRSLTARSGGQIQLEEIDPSPFSAAEDAAIGAGLEPIPTEGGGQIFFGLTGRNAVDDQRVIALFDPNDEARLEYEIVRVIAELERARTPVIAIVSDLPFAPNFDGRSANPIVDALAQTFEIEWLDAGFETLPETADALFLFHAAPLSQAQAYEIDQFALSKGRVLALIDPMAHVALKPGPDGLPPINAERASSLPALLASWGVVYDVNTVAMDAETGLPVQIVEAGRTRTRAYPLWFQVRPASMNRNLPAAASLSRGVNLGSPGVLSPVEGFESRFSPLLQTSQAAARIDADRAASSPAPEDLLRELEPAQDAPLTLAAQIDGVFRTAFPDGPPEAASADPAQHRSQSDGPGEIVVIADTDLLDPAFYLTSNAVEGEQLLADNLALILNLADRLAGDPALVSLRSRASSARPMHRVEALRSEAEARYLDLQGRLQAQLFDAETRLAELNATGRGSALGGASDNDSAEANALRAEILDARERLREIERGFRVDIDALERALLFWTVWVPPLGVMGLALIFFLVRRRKQVA